MSVINQIVPGSVRNFGIGDASIPNYTPSQVTTALHLPVISAVFPKGPLAEVIGTHWIRTSDIGQIFGDIMDPDSPLYSPTSLLIQQLAAGGQSVVGIRRLSVNNEQARVALSAFVKKVTVEDYERDLNGRFKRNADGDRIPTGTTYQGLDVVIKHDPEAAKKGVGELEVRTIAGGQGEGETFVFPLTDYVAGVGDEYNKSGLQLGVRNTTLNYRSVTEFIKETGVYPLELKMFTETTAGVRIPTKTVTNTDSTLFTLFDAVYKKVRYSVKRGVGDFTNTNRNRKVVARPAPFNSVHVYQENIETLCQMLYASESKVNESLLEVTNRPYRQMNPFTLVDHTGAPYYTLTSSENFQWDLTGSVKATGGISPLLTKEGKLPAYVKTPEVNDPFGLLEGVEFPVTQAQSWQVINALMAADMIVYRDSLDIKNYTKNRQSVFWDVGYTQEVKDAAEQLLNSRKDVMVFPCATVWEPGRQNTLPEIYSRLNQLSTAVKMYPESELHGTPTCRASINTIYAQLVDEETADRFSGNLDLAYSFALFAGNAEGVIRPAMSPDSGENRTLRTMHSPLVEFEDNTIGGDNFDKGGITLRTKDVDQLFRPALPTVYSNPDSVLKDVITVFLCVCIEKIAQDEWNNLSGDTTKSAAEYVALFKDGAERKCRDRLGALVRQITFNPTYNETTPGGRAVMKTTGHAYFNKGKYMMDLDLFAYNEQDLDGTNA